MNFRNNFARLADALIAEDQFEKAEKVLDRCIEVMPNETVHTIIQPSDCRRILPYQ